MRAHKARGTCPPCGRLRIARRKIQTKGVAIMCDMGHAAHMWRQEKGGELVCVRCGARGVQIVPPERAREIAAAIAADILREKGLAPA